MIQELADKNLQSDERFAELFVEQRINKGYGKHKIRAELRDRGVDSELAKQSLVENDTDWVRLAHSVLLRKYGQYDESFNSKKLLKCKRHMHSRGFSQSQIIQAVELWAQTEGEWTPD